MQIAKVNNNRIITKYISAALRKNQINQYAVYADDDFTIPKLESIVILPQ